MNPEDTLDQSFRQLAGVMDEYRAPASTPNPDPVVAVMQKVASALKIRDLSVSKLAKEQPIFDQIEQICQESRLRYRRVLLRGDWSDWECTALVASHKNRQDPVALIRKGQDWKMWDPAVDRWRAVTDSLRAQLAPDAVQVYPIKTLSNAVPAIKKELRLPLVASALSALILLFFPLATQWTFETVIATSDWVLWQQILAGLVVASAASLLFSFTKALGFLRILDLLLQDLMQAVWNRLLMWPEARFRHYSSADLSQRVTALLALRTLLSGYDVLASINALYSVVYLLLMAIYSPSLCALVMVPIALFLLFQWWAVRRGIGLRRQSCPLEAELQLKLMDVIQGITKLRTSQADKRFYARWLEPFSHVLKLELSLGRLNFFQRTVLDLLVPICLIVAFAGAEGLSLPAFLGFQAALGAFLVGLREFQRTCMLIPYIIPEVERFNTVLEAPVEASPSRTAILAGGLSVKNMSFCYPHEVENAVSGISFDVGPGKSIAFVGPSGAGKSTLLRLLIGFEKPDHGSVYYDHTDLQFLDKSSVRRQIGVVLQDAQIPEGSLRDYVTVCGHYSDAEVLKALELADFSRDLEELPMGLYTMLASNAGVLSGGQRQRLQIARALLSRPKVLLLDEATSHLDNQSQARVQHNLKGLGITLVIFAHRLSTIEAVDQICVLSQGQVVEQGTYTELVAKKGLFSKLLERQSL